MLHLGGVFSGSSHGNTECACIVCMGVCMFVCLCVCMNVIVRAGGKRVGGQKRGKRKGKRPLSRVSSARSCSRFTVFLVYGRNARRSVGMSPRGGSGKGPRYFGGEYFLDISVNALKHIIRAKNVGERQVFATHSKKR